MTDALSAGRLQFAFTIMFHYLFPVLTMGLGVLIAVMKTVQLVKKDDRYGVAARFWAKIFAITFAMGVVTGIPMEFQFGTNWSEFSHFAGGVVGQTLFMEGVFAFFAESSFLGLFLFGEKRLSAWGHWLASVMVAFGAVLSGYFIVATNAWMQNPVAYQVVNGRAQLESLKGLLTNPYVIWQYPHAISGSLLTASMVVAGIGAYYLLAQRNEQYGRMFVKVGVSAGVIFSITSLFPTGSLHGERVARFQPVKMAAMEGVFQTGPGAGLAILGMPDVEKGELMDPIVVPRVLSFLAYGDPRAVVVGLNDYPREMWPPVEIVYYAYHIMVGLGSIFIGIMILSLFLLWKNRLFKTRLFLWILMLAMPFPYIANHAGWVVAEVGRQPWIVYGVIKSNTDALPGQVGSEPASPPLFSAAPIAPVTGEGMKTADGLSPNVTAGMVWFTLLGFMGLYALLGLLYIYLFLRIVNAGPEAAHVSEKIPTIGTGGAPVEVPS